MTKTKSRRNKTSTKQAKNSTANTEEIKKDEKEREVPVQEELRCGDNEKGKLLERNEQGNGNREYLGPKLKNKIISTNVGRVLVLVLVTILAFVTRYYNLREPKHVW